LVYCDPLLHGTETYKKVVTSVCETFKKSPQCSEGHLPILITQRKHNLLDSDENPSAILVTKKAYDTFKLQPDLKQIEGYSREEFREMQEMAKEMFKKV